MGIPVNVINGGATGPRDDAFSMARHVWRRSWAIALFALCGASLAWYALRDDPKVYERTLSFVILPSRTLEQSEIPNAMRSLSQQNSQISGTIAAAVGSKPALERAAQAALGQTLGPGYEIETGVVPGSDMLVTRLRGRDQRVLAELSPSLSTDTVAWVGANLGSYRLAPVESTASPGPVAPKLVEMTVVAGLLAAAIAFAAAYLEGAFTRRRWREAAGGADSAVITPLGDGPRAIGRDATTLHQGAGASDEAPQDIEAHRRR